MKASTDCEDIWLTFHKCKTTMNKDRHLLMNAVLHLPWSKVCWQFAKKSFIHWQKLLSRIMFICIQKLLFNSVASVLLWLSLSAKLRSDGHNKYIAIRIFVFNSKILSCSKGDTWLYFQGYLQPDMLVTLSKCILTVYGTSEYSLQSHCCVSQVSVQFWKYFSASL